MYIFFAFHINAPFFPLTQEQKHKIPNTIKARNVIVLQSDIIGINMDRMKK